MFLISPPADFSICFFSNVFFFNYISCMLTKMVTSICKMFFLTHKKNLIFISTKCEDIKRWNSHILRVWTFYGNSYFYWFPIVHCRSKQSLCNPGVNLKYQLKGRLKVVVLSIYCFKGIRRSQYFCHHCHKYGKNIINSHLFFLWHIYNFSHGHRRRRAVSFRLSLTQEE